MNQLTIIGDEDADDLVVFTPPGKTEDKGTMYFTDKALVDIYIAAQHRVTGNMLQSYELSMRDFIQASIRCGFKFAWHVQQNQDGYYVQQYEFEPLCPNRIHPLI